MPQSSSFANRTSSPGMKGPLWAKIATIISAEIGDHSLAPGTQLETELQFAARFGVSRFTIRQAVADLETLGVVRIEHGRGLFVAEQAIPFVLNSHIRLTENLDRLGLSGTRDFLEGYRDQVDEEHARFLQIPAGADVIVVRSISYVEGRQICLTRNLYPADRFAGIDALLRDNPSPTAALKQFGVDDYQRVSTRISSRMPKAEEAELLGIARTRPLLDTAKIDADMTGRPIAWGVSSFPADRVHLIME